MKFTNGTAYAMLLSFNNMLQDFQDKKISSVIIFGIMRNTRILNMELTEFMGLRQEYMEKYRIDEDHINDKDIEERIHSCEMELTPVANEEIDINLHHISYDFDELQNNLENADVPLNMQDVAFLQLICKQPDVKSNEV